ncbi:hypothetical protein JOD97_005893 [Duganella sp. 1411]|jgi:hypothetical protein|nr:hypothetical protein [Duganella sp. 1411]
MAINYPHTFTAAGRELCIFVLQSLPTLTEFIT